MKKGTKEAAQEAMQYYEKLLDIYKRIKLATAVAKVENSILIAKAMCEGKNKENKEEKLKHSQKTYELTVKRYGQDAPTTIREGVNLAIVLWNAHHAMMCSLLSLQTLKH